MKRLFKASRASLCGAAVLGWVGFLSAPARAAEVAAAPQAQAAPRDAYDGPPLLLGKGRKLRLGGYGGVTGGYTRFLGRSSGFAGLEGAFLLDHRLSLGLAGYGLTRTPDGPDALDGTEQQFALGYGGFLVRYALFGNSPVYGSLGLLLGGGAVNLHPARRWGEGGWDEDRYQDDGSFDPFLVLQPDLTLHANVTRWLRLGATVGYRFTGGVERFGLQESDLNAIVAGGQIQLGWF